MLLSSLRHEVLAANLELHRLGLTLYTWGNVSGIDRESGLVVIKPSGVPYEALTVEQLVVVDLADHVVEGAMRPSSDTRTHIALYRAWPDIGGIAHAHAPHATAWCQARRALPCLGTTHADHCRGPVPCTDILDAADVAGDYEAATGAQIVATFSGGGAPDHTTTPMVLLAGHAPFTWGGKAREAAYHAVVLEEMARIAALTLALDPQAVALPAAIADRHYLRKHGALATYGQRRP